MCFFCDPDKIKTYDLLIRSHIPYSVEPRSRFVTAELDNIF